MIPDEIRVGVTYTKVGVAKSRTVLAIKGDIVQYTVQGLLTFMPMEMPIDGFADWADTVVEKGKPN